LRKGLFFWAWAGPSLLEMVRPAFRRGGFLRLYLAWAAILSSRLPGRYGVVFRGGKKTPFSLGGHLLPPFSLSFDFLGGNLPIPLLYAVFFSELWHGELVPLFPFSSYVSSNVDDTIIPLPALSPPLSQAQSGLAFFPLVRPHKVSPDSWTPTSVGNGIGPFFHPTPTRLFPSFSKASDLSFSPLSHREFLGASIKSFLLPPHTSFLSFF